MVTKQKHFLDSLRHMVSKSVDSVCPSCQKTYPGEFCPHCNADNLGGESQQDNSLKIDTAYLVDLVSNHKIRIPTPICKVGRDETNDIVVSGDQSISRHHVGISCEGNQYYIEDNKSRHGTFLNGTQISTREAISDGDVIKIGVSLFWFVIESGAASGDDMGVLPDGAEATSGLTKSGAHMTVKSDILTQPSDPSACTMNEIPVMPNEQSLLDSLRLKTRSFDQGDLFSHAQTQPGTIGSQPPLDHSQSLSDTQTVLPSLEELSAGNPANRLDSPPAQTTSPELEKSNARLSDLASGSTIYDQLMRADLAELTDKHSKLKTKIDETQRQMQDIANQLNTIRTLGISLIGGSGNELVTACRKVLTELGWQISANEEDPQELRLKTDDQSAIARIIWISEEPQRGHLGQLSMAQTRLWCEQGQEPKGILVISQLPNKDNQISLAPNAEHQGELTNYAAKKNVCIMTSVQLLAIYRDLVLKNGDVSSLREKIINSNGWLAGFTIKPPQP